MLDTLLEMETSIWQGNLLTQFTRRRLPKRIAIFQHLVQFAHQSVILSLQQSFLVSIHGVFKLEPSQLLLELLHRLLQLAYLLLSGSYVFFPRLYHVHKRLPLLLQLKLPGELRFGYALLKRVVYGSTYVPCDFIQGFALSTGGIIGVHLRRASQPQGRRRFTVSVCGCEF